jgi:hypothetical protein
MSAYSPPVENVPIFDAGLFRTTNGEGEFLTIAEANRLYLQFPFGQGTETIPAVNITGNATIGGTLVVAPPSPTASATLQSTSLSFSSTGGDIISGSYTGNAIALLDDATGSSVGTAGINATAINSTGTLTASLGGGVVGMPSPPYPAPDANWSLSVDSGTYNPTLYMSKSAVFTNSTSLTLGLTSLAFNQGTGNPSPNDDFTISSNKNLLLGGANFEVSASSILFGSVASSVFATHTATGFNAIDNTSSAFAFYRNNQLSIYGTGNASLLANKTALTYTDSAGTGTGALSSSSLTMISPTTGSSLYNAGSARISSANSTGAPTPILTLENSTAGASAGVAIETNKNGGAGVVGDEVFRLSMKGKNSGNTTAEYGRITCNIRDPTTSGAGIDGGLILAVPVNNTMTSFLDLNGNNGRANCLVPLDMRTNSIVSTTGNITLDASSSSGTGAIALTTKAGTAGSGAGLLLTGNTLTSGSSGGNSGQHLCLTINGVVYKIALQNP